MQLEQLELTGGGTLTLYLRESVEAMPHFRQRPLVLVDRKSTRLNSSHSH